MMHPQCYEPEPVPPTNQVDLTLQELARLSLGGDHLTNHNTTALHSLLLLILKKLNCQDELVTIGGHEAKCIEKLLQETKSCPLNFNDEQMELITTQLERLNVLEKRIGSFEVSLGKHIEAKRQCDITNADPSYTWPNWEHYSKHCDDMCDSCAPDFEVACSLYNNTDFLKKLMRRLTKPMCDRIFALEQEILKLYEEFNSFMDRAEEEYKKVELIERCLQEIGALRKVVTYNQSLFLASMEEVQDVLDTKFDKVHIPAMKKWIKDQFEAIDAEIKHINEMSDCPKAPGLVMGAIKCVCCGGNRVCAEIGNYATGVLPNANPGKVIEACQHIPQKKEIDCKCAGFPSPDPTVRERIFALEVQAAEEKEKLRLRHEATKAKTCETSEQLLMGTNGNMFRADPDDRVVDDISLKEEKCEG